MAGKPECNLCQPIVTTLEQAYSSASEAFRQLKVDGWMKEFHDTSCPARDRVLCLPLIALFSKASGDAGKGLE